MIEKPAVDRGPGDDVLSAVLRSVRLSGAMQFCFMPTGDWQTDAAPTLATMAPGPARAMPFHIVVDGRCWLKVEDLRVDLQAGDVVAFPFGAGHQLGAGEGGMQVNPVADLPAKPWRQTPVLTYGAAGARVRLFCGYLEFGAAGFQPLNEALPRMMHARTAGSDELAWLGATLAQIAAEVDSPRPGGVSMLERLTEITFIELLRHHMASNPPGAVGWRAAMADPALGRCLAAIHGDPTADWSLETLGDAAALSRSALAERFERVLGVSPMRYVRDWRLCLASVALADSRRSVAAIAHEAGYGAEAAFNRAFSRAYGFPPARWRQLKRTGA